MRHVTGLATKILAGLLMVPVASAFTPGSLPRGAWTSSPLRRPQAASTLRHLPIILGRPVNPQPFKTRFYLETLEEEPRDPSLAGRWLAAGGPRWATLLDEALFLVGSIVFIVGSLDFYPGVPLAQYVEGCELFIVGSVIFLGLALFSAYEIWEDAKLAKTPPAADLILEEVLYVLGSTLFLAGTVLYLPPIIGTDVAAASAAAVAADDVALALKVPWFGLTTIEVIVRNGASMPKPPEASVVSADILFVIGSVIFSIAAFVSALKAVGGDEAGPDSALRRRTAVATASLYELGGVAFAVGTLGYIPAPILGIAACPVGVQRLTYAGATLFVMGSGFYTLGSALTLAVTSYLTYADDDTDTGGSVESLYSPQVAPRRRKI